MKTEVIGYTKSTVVGVTVDKAWWTCMVEMVQVALSRGQKPRIDSRAEGRWDERHWVPIPAPHCTFCGDGESRWLMCNAGEICLHT